MRETNRSNICFQVKKDEVDSPRTFFISEIVLPTRRHSYRSFAEIVVFETVLINQGLTNMIKIFEAMEHFLIQTGKGRTTGSDR